MTSHSLTSSYHRDCARRLCAAASRAALILILTGSAQAKLHAQDTTVVNPRQIAFDLPSGPTADIVAYRVELFVHGADVATAPPVRSLDVPRRGRGEKQIVADMEKLLEGVPDGVYVATVRAVARGAVSVRSVPTEPFAVSGQPQTTRPPSEERSAPAPRPQPAAPAAEPEKEPLAWTLIGIAMGVAAFVLGYLLR